MNPETAKQTIQAYLDLGTLQGVKVVSSTGEITRCYKIDFEPALPDVVWYTTKSVQNRTTHPEMFYFTMNPNNIPPFLRDITAIHPIPLQPKLLEVGDRVRVIDGEYEGKVGLITTNNVGEGLYNIDFDDGVFAQWISMFNVVPEYLLVEEEESEAPLCQCSSILAALIRGEITDEEATQKIIKHEVQLAKHVLDGGFKTSPQAGYKVVKK